ncbi:MAG: DUF2961 domain-containing protein [Gammaproteobacteria bacterium]|nr:DUF2961 domain-containing protein [Gammaproteobacteria bacterium]
MDASLARLQWPPGRPGSAASSSGGHPGSRRLSGSTCLAPGARLVLADLAGPGMLRHLRLVIPDTPQAGRGLMIRTWWDGQPHPSIEAPVGDFFGFAHGRSLPFGSAVHSVGAGGVMDLWLPMPFAKRAYVVIDNELSEAIALQHVVAFTHGDALPPDAGNLHACFRRETRTRTGEDFEFMPHRQGRGRFLGVVFGIIPLEHHWWGEGEAKFFLDGDTAFPTLVGTGAEDYVGLAWNVQQTCFPLHGASLVRKSDTPNMAGPVSMYRWHTCDPIYWHREIRATIQQLGVDITGEGTMRSFASYLACLRERQDDWSSCSFWYEPLPSAPLPEAAPLALRLHDLEWACAPDNR